MINNKQKQFKEKMVEIFDIELPKSKGKKKKRNFNKFISRKFTFQKFRPEMTIKKIEPIIYISEVENLNYVEE